MSTSRRATPGKSGRSEAIDAIDAISVLAEPTRRRLYEAVTGSSEPIDRDRAAEATGVSRELAAFHLDRLVDAGLLQPVFRRRTGRTGPGAGRPAKFYGRSGSTFSVSVPARDYELAAMLFAAALDATPRSSARRHLDRIAHDYGVALGGSAPRNTRRSAGGSRAALVDALERAGFEPDTANPDVIRLRNCPFNALADHHRNVICPMNLAMLLGLVESVGADVVARPLPADRRCCVEFVPAANAGI